MKELDSHVKKWPFRARMGKIDNFILRAIGFIFDHLKPIKNAIKVNC